MVFRNFLLKVKDADILSNLADGVILIDASGKVELVNDTACIILNIAKGEFLKSNINDVIESGLDLTKQIVENAKSAVGKAKTTSDRELFLEITGRILDDYYLLSIRDVTQSYKTVSGILMEHEVSKKINKDKNAFLVKLSNELKSPVHSILGFSQAMVEGLGGDMSEKQAKYIKIINKNSNDMLYLMDKIVELSKTESNLFEYDFQIFDVINTIQGVMKNNEAAVKEKNLNMTFDTEDIVKRTIFSDEGALKIILQNILETAIKSTDIGSIKIKAHHPDLEFVFQHEVYVPQDAVEKSYMMFSITDTGIGLNENELAVLFEPYAQLDKPNKKNIVKSIALASAKNLVKTIGGDIWVESESMQGTTYNFIIPAEKFHQE